jgi:hypothetical protein
MATIITTHIAMNNAAALSQFCSGSFVHSIDTVVPLDIAISLGMVIPPDMDLDQ